LVVKLEAELSPVLAGLRELDPEPAAVVVEAEPGWFDAGIEKLTGLVRDNDPDAVPLAAELASLGRGGAAAERLEELARALEAFDFEAATGLLERIGKNAD
jgi:hypothetical protein